MWTSPTWTHIPRCSRGEPKEEKNQQRCCVQSTNVENLRGYQVSLFVIFTDWGIAYSRSIYYPNQRYQMTFYRWISLMEINIKKYFLYSHSYIHDCIYKIFIISPSVLILVNDSQWFIMIIKMSILFRCLTATTKYKNFDHYLVIIYSPAIWEEQYCERET
jgi:hypothetical protein